MIVIIIIVTVICLIISSLLVGCYDFYMIVIRGILFSYSDHHFLEILIFGGYCDFGPIHGLEGIYLANQYQDLSKDANPQGIEPRVCNTLFLFLPKIFTRV